MVELHANYILDNACGLKVGNFLRVDRFRFFTFAYFIFPSRIETIVAKQPPTLTFDPWLAESCNTKYII